MGTQKISVTVNSEVLKAARRRAKRRRESLSSVVNEALVKQAKLEHLRELLARDERKFGPVPEELREDVRRRWPA